MFVFILLCFVLCVFVSVWRLSAGPLHVRPAMLSAPALGPLAYLPSTSRFDLEIIMIFQTVSPSRESHPVSRVRTI